MDPPRYTRKPHPRHRRPPGGSIGFTQDEWQAAWTAEIDRRVREIDDGTAELLDGDEVLADARSWLDAQRK